MGKQNNNHKAAIFKFTRCIELMETYSKMLVTLNAAKDGWCINLIEFKRIIYQCSL